MRVPRRRRCRVGLGVIAALALGPAFARVQAQVCTTDTVPRSEVARVMQIARRAYGEYDIIATTNWTRFQSVFFLELVRRAQQRAPAGGVLFIRPDDLFFEFLAVADLTEKPDSAPQHRLLAYQYEQGIQLEYRPGGIVEAVESGPQPILAVNVRVAWYDRPDGSSKYSLVDTLSVPKLKVTNHQVITYRLVDFGSMVAYDQIEGLSGRPLSGLLGALFKLIGEGSVKWSRFSFSEDGLQVVRAKAKKIFSKTATVTIYPDGRAEKDVPADRPDLAEIADRLERNMNVAYFRYQCW